MADFKRFTARYELKKRHPEYKKILAEIPSFKTASYTKYLERLQYFWSNGTFLLNFSAEQPFFEWEFFRKRMARVAVDAIAKRIVSTVNMKTCVACEDWSRRDGIKGHASNSVKGLAGALQKRVTVVIMNEVMTSKLCSQCHHTLCL